MAIHIRRREFIFALGGAGIAWPLTARAALGIGTGTVQRIANELG